MSDTYKTVQKVSLIPTRNDQHQKSTYLANVTSVFEGRKRRTEKFHGLSSLYQGLIGKDFEDAIRTTPSQYLKSNFTLARNICEIQVQTQRETS